MKIIEAQKLLDRVQKRDSIYLFTQQNLGVLFSEDGETLRSTLKRLAANKILTKVASNLYAGSRISESQQDVLSMVAARLRAGEANYLSMESVLCNHSIISQQMLDRITVMTSGRSGEFKTPYGVVEFTHTKRDPIEILKSTQTSPRYAIRIASPQVAYRDLKRVGRNLEMVDLEELEELNERS
jgi:hypothetical protein